MRPAVVISTWACFQHCVIFSLYSYGMIFYIFFAFRVIMMMTMNLLPILWAIQPQEKQIKLRRVNGERKRSPLRHNAYPSSYHRNPRTPASRTTPQCVRIAPMVKEEDCWSSFTDRQPSPNSHRHQSLYPIHTWRTFNKSWTRDDEVDHLQRLNPASQFLQ